MSATRDPAQVAKVVPRLTRATHRIAQAVWPDLSPTQPRLIRRDKYLQALGLTHRNTIEIAITKLVEQGVLIRCPKFEFLQGIATGEVVRCMAGPAICAFDLIAESFERISPEGQTDFSDSLQGVEHTLVSALERVLEIREENDITLERTHRKLETLKERGSQLDLLVDTLKEAQWLAHTILEEPDSS